MGNADDSHRGAMKDMCDRFNVVSAQGGQESQSNSDSLFCRRTPDGHSILFSLNIGSWKKQPQIIGLITLSALLALTALAYALVRKWLAPLNAIRQGVERYSKGDFGKAIPQRQPDELGELSERINRMASELEQMLEAKRGLLLAISHELRSPLTRAKLNLELLPELDKDSLGTKAALLRDLNLMRDLVTDLLESERLNQSHAVLQREACDLREVAKKALASLADTQVAASVKCSFAVDLPQMMLDANRMQLLMRNLLSNALLYGQTQSGAEQSLPPELTINRSANGVEIIVRDFGPGLPESSLPRLTEAFYRPSQARSRSDGGVGLGLYLVGLVAKAHGADLHIRNAKPGLEVAVRIDSCK
jgi:signal transduction histidine kinase